MSHAFLRRSVAAAALVTLAATGAQAATINKDNSVVSSIPGMAGFATTGAMMTGLSVTATFTDGFSETLLWSTTGAESGGVTGTGWSLSLDGDSFTSLWNFGFTAATVARTLASLTLDGSDALTVFDTTEPSTGTPGSDLGLDLSMADAGLDALAVADYSKVVAIGLGAPIGDLYQSLVITFSQGGPRTDFSFSQDTDNDARIGIPTPGALALVGVALAGLGLQRRRAA